MMTLGGLMSLTVSVVADLVVLGDQDAGTSRFERHFLHRPEHVRLYREGELQTQITDVIVQDPLQVLSILWIDGRHVLIVHRDTWETQTHALNIVRKVGAMDPGNDMIGEMKEVRYLNIYDIN